MTNVFFSVLLVLLVPVPTQSGSVQTSTKSQPGQCRLGAVLVKSAISRRVDYPFTADIFVDVSQDCGLKNVRAYIAGLPPGVIVAGGTGVVVTIANGRTGVKIGGTAKGAADYPISIQLTGDGVSSSKMMTLTLKIKRE